MRQSTANKKVDKEIATQYGQSKQNEQTKNKKGKKKGIKETKLLLNRNRHRKKKSQLHKLVKILIDGRKPKAG